MSQIAQRGETEIFSEPLPPGCGASHVVFYRACFHVDVDGSKTAYGPHNTGTDYTANAGEPNHWWALVCGRDGQPIVQDGDYVSTTSLQDPNFAADDRRRYVDAQSIPYFVLPAAHFRSWGVKLGDLAWIQKLDRQEPAGSQVVAVSAAIFADAGPDVGEGSAELARRLELNPDPRRGGTDERCVQVYVFAGSGDGRPLPVGEIDRRVQALVPALQKLGGMAAPIVKAT